MNAPTPIEISIAAFVKRHSRDKRHEPRDQLLRYVAWYWRDGRCGVLRCDGRIVAVALVRALSDLAQHALPYRHDETGNIVWIDDIISRHPQGLAYLVAMARKRFGVRETFAGHVFARAGELRLMPWRTLERLAA